MDLGGLDLKHLVYIYIPYSILEGIKWISSRTLLANEQFKLLHAISESQQKVSESQERVAEAFNEVASVLAKILTSITVLQRDTDLDDEEVN